MYYKIAPAPALCGRWPRRVAFAFFSIVAGGIIAVLVMDIMSAANQDEDDGVKAVAFCRNREVYRSWHPDSEAEVYPYGVLDLNTCNLGKERFRGRPDCEDGMGIGERDVTVS